MIPLGAKDGGMFGRHGRTEAAMDLARLAGRRPAGVLCEIVSAEQPGADGPARGGGSFARPHQLRVVSISDLLAYRRHTEPQVERVATTAMPTVRGRFRAVAHRGLHDVEHIALIVGQVEGQTDVPVHVHCECLSGDVFGAVGCACEAALASAQTTIADTGRGVIVYVRRAGPPRACGLFEPVDDESRQAAAEGGLRGPVRSERRIRDGVGRNQKFIDEEALVAVIGFDDNVMREAKYRGSTNR